MDFGNLKMYIDGDLKSSIEKFWLIGVGCFEGVKEQTNQCRDILVL